MALLKICLRLSGSARRIVFEVYFRICLFERLFETLWETDKLCIWWYSSSSVSIKDILMCLHLIAKECPDNDMAHKVMYMILPNEKEGDTTE